MKLEGKVAIVTGAGRGIGAAVAVRLAAEGAAVAVVDLNEASAESTAEAIRRDGGRARAFRCDVSDADRVSAMMEDAPAAFGGADILVNNAGLIRDAQMKNMTEDMWDLVLDVNLKGSWLCARAAAPHLAERGGGKIVNVSSRAAQGNFGQTNYSAAKAGVQGLTRALALELARFNVNVNCVAPGFIDTPLWETVPEAARERILKGTPLQRAGRPEDVANAILFFCSEDSSFITGQTLYVCGGRSLTALAL